MRLRVELNKQSGFSLIELMIALAVTLVVLASVFSMMGSAVKSSQTTYELADAQQGLRIAQAYINRDLLNAGDGLRVTNNIRLPVGFVQTWLTTNLVNPSGGYVNLTVLNSDNNVPGTTVVAGTNPAVNVLDGTDRITILERDPGFLPVGLPPNSITSSGSNVSITPPDVTRFNIGEIYFITSSVGSTFGTITDITGVGGNSPNLIFANSDTYGLNAPGNGGPINVVSGGGTLPTSLMRMQIIHYFINANKLLIKRVFGVGGGAGFTDSVIAEHVTALQFRYVLNMRDAGGRLQQPVAQITTAPQQSAIEQVEALVTVTTAHPILKNAVQPITQTTRTSIRNIQFSGALKP